MVEVGGGGDHRGGTACLGVSGHKPFHLSLDPDS